MKGTLDGLAPGIYLSRDLYARYSRLMASQGREGVTSKTLGEALARVMRLERKRGKDNSRAFLVTPEAVAGRDWFKD